MDLLRNGLNRAYCRVSARLKCHFFMFISILVFSSRGSNLEPCKARHKDLCTENIECLSY